MPSAERSDVDLRFDAVKPVWYLGVTDRDDLAREPASPPPDQQPAGGAEGSPPQQWSGPPPQQHHSLQHPRSPGYPAAAPPPGYQPAPPPLGDTDYCAETAMFFQPRHGETPQQWQQPAPPREPSTAPHQGGQRSSGPGGGDRPGAAPPGGWNYVEGIRASGLVPARKIPPGRGWQRLIYNATGGLINLSQSADELRQGELEVKIRTPLHDQYKIGVLGKGGVGKTTVAACVGSIFAQVRLEDRVVAIDADTAFGQLGSRIDPETPGSYWDLAADQHLDTFADLRTQVGNDADGLFVLPGESAIAELRVLDPAIYRQAASQLDRHFTISIIDCSATVDSPVTQEVLRDLDGLIVVSSPWVDGATAAAQTMEWLAALGMLDLLHRTVVVLNDSDGHADKRTRTVLAQHFASHGLVVMEVPFDAHLRPGGVIDINNEMSPKTRRRFYEIAAAIADHFKHHPGTT